MWVGISQSAGVGSERNKKMKEWWIHSLFLSWDVLLLPSDIGLQG